MYVISMLNQKGGVGKTTLTLNVADALARQGLRAMVIDADPQGSALDWSAAREGDAPPFPVVGLATKTLNRDLPDVAEGRDVVVIDGPPRTTDIARAAIIASDLVVIPVQPSPYDIWSADDVVKLISEGQIYKPALKAVFAINRAIVKTNVGKEVMDALAGYELAPLAHVVHQRVSFVESAAVGKTVLETHNNSAGADEIRGLALEILRIVKGSD